MNLRGMMSNIRVRCGGPRAQRPNDRTLLLLISTQVQNFLTEANLYGRNWAVDELQLTITPNQQDYQLATEGFGKPIEVRATYSGNPSYIDRDIDFYELGDLHFNWNAPNNIAQAGSIDGSPHTTDRVAFFRRNGNIYARIMPVPAQSATFTVLYQVGIFGETMALDEGILLPEHHALIELRTAVSALPHCEWSDDPRINADTRKELALTLERDLQRLEPNFRAYLNSQTASNRPTYRELPFDID